MALSSKQFVRARISRAKFRQLRRLFALDLTATQMTALSDLNRDTVDRYLRLIRQASAEHCQRESPFSGDVEFDESYLGARRVRGKRGRGARGKIIVFGIYKRNGRVPTGIVPNCKKAGKVIALEKTLLDSLLGAPFSRLVPDERLPISPYGFRFLPTVTVVPSNFVSENPLKFSL